MGRQSRQAYRVVRLKLDTLSNMSNSNAHNQVYYAGP